MPTPEEYIARVKTGQDLLDLRVIPKDSSTHLALIARERLQRLREKIDSQITDDDLGAWVPAVKKIGKEYTGEVSDPEIILRLGQPGMRVEGRGVHDGRDFKGLAGILRGTKKNEILVEFDRPIAGGHDCDGLAKKGYGFRMAPEKMAIMLAPGQTLVDAKEYALGKDIVAHEHIGHIVRVATDLPAIRAWDNDDTGVQLALKSGTFGRLYNCQTSKGSGKRVLTVKFDDPVNNKQIYQFHLETIADCFQVSSLGQLKPHSREELVRDETFFAFFPSTVIATKRAERALVALLMGKDKVFYGPPGGGKSQIARDITDIAKLQGVGFVVEGCKANCNPFSLFDESFARVVPPCPECMIHHSPDFRTTGRFTRPKPEDVKVIVTNYGDGKGIEFLQGKVAIQAMHLIGYKLPTIPGDTSGTVQPDLHDDSNPEGFMAGALVRTNNGVLHADEMDKWRQQALDVLLESLNSGRVKPDELRYAYPAHSLVVGTANDHTKFSGALNDRMALLAIRYPGTVSDRHRITRRAYHGEVTPAEEVPIGDTHTMQNEILRRIPMAVTLEKAVDAFYMKFENEFTGAGKNEISASNRSKIDALNAARASLLLERTFFKDAPLITAPKHAMFGIQFAVCGRVQKQNREEEQKAKQELVDYIHENLPPILKQEENTWWCETYRHAGFRDKQVPGTIDYFVSEMKLYETAIGQAATVFELIKRGRDPAASVHDKKARITYPFMDYLFKEQPRMASFTNDEVSELIKYFLQSRENTICTIE
ncbi:hypothetical protein HYZ97_01605 [Candidatus Pacearchaeota archaeon]|nr:hypothetical protein [Candidatus Pacearchaeota archaeon]